MNIEVKPRDVYRARNVWTTSISASEVFLPHVIRSLVSGLHSTRTADGGTVVKVLRYKSEDRWCDSRWCHWNFSLT
jgi:hypothetical protein